MSLGERVIACLFMHLVSGRRVYKTFTLVKICLARVFALLFLHALNVFMLFSLLKELLKQTEHNIFVMSFFQTVYM